MRCFPLRVLLALVCSVVSAAETPAPPILFNTAFESGSLGLIEKLGATEFRLHIKGQQDARGRNRQATWFFFKMEDVAGRELTLHLTGFKGEYNDLPAKSPAGDWYRPVYSEDGQSWTHLKDATWEDASDSLTFTVRPTGDTLWLAHIPPYTHERLLTLLKSLAPRPEVRMEIIGQSVLGRPLHLLTVTNFGLPDAPKKVVWLQARQHAWEADTSLLMEGALRFATSDDPASTHLRDTTIFKFLPMLNPDSVSAGEVRFNANGFDPNRQWDQVDLNAKLWLSRTPEIWYAKNALLAQQARQPIALALNLHNTETGEYLETMADDPAVLARMEAFFARLLTTTSFDPLPPKLRRFTTGPGTTTNSIWRDAGVPMMLMEQRIGPSEKLGHIPTSDERLTFGQKLIRTMAETAHSSE